MQDNSPIWSLREKEQYLNKCLMEKQLFSCKDKHISPKAQRTRNISNCTNWTYNTGISLVRYLLTLQRHIISNVYITRAAVYTIARSCLDIRKHILTKMFPWHGCSGSSSLFIWSEFYAMHKNTVMVLTQRLPALWSVKNGKEPSGNNAATGRCKTLSRTIVEVCRH